MDLSSGDYLFFRYDNTTKKAVFSEKVQVSSGSAKSIVDSCADYFFAKRAIMGELQEPSAISPESPAQLLNSAINPTGSGKLQQKLESVADDQPVLAGRLAESIQQKKEGENTMSLGSFSADDVLVLLGAALQMGSVSAADFLTPIAILIGAAMICVCIILLNRSNQKRMMMQLVTSPGGTLPGSGIAAPQAKAPTDAPASVEPAAESAPAEEPKLTFVQVGGGKGMENPQNTPS